MAVDGSYGPTVSTPGGGAAAESVALMSSTDTATNLNSVAPVPFQLDVQHLLESGWGWDPTFPTRLAIVAGGPTFAAVLFSGHATYRSTGIRLSVGLQVFKNGAAIVAGSAGLGVGYIRAASGHNESSSPIGAVDLAPSVGDFYELMATRQSSTASTATGLASTLHFEARGRT